MVFLGGTDEQFGYTRTGIFDECSADIIMATGTSWSMFFCLNKKHLAII